MIGLGDHPLDRVLETCGIIHFDDNLPGGRRENRTVHREQELASERCGEVMTDVDPVLVLEIVDIMDCLRVVPLEKCINVLDDERWILHRNGCDTKGVG